MSRRILVINERDLRNPLAGGAEVHVFEIFKRLVARGHQVTLLAASFKGAAREEDVEGIRVCRLAN
ncbi:MAG: glycosyltransferase, partial [Deltaproteobacteria bacterium]